MSYHEKLRPTRKHVKYYSTEDSQNSEDTNTSDSSFTMKKQLGVTRLENRMRQVVNMNFKKLHRLDHINDSTSSQDSTDVPISRTHKSRKNSKSMAYKNHKRERLVDAITQSQSQLKPIVIDDTGDGSDSSFLFTDEISEASFSRKEHPETLNKSVLLKTRQNTSKKLEKNRNPKRKELSATRKATKRLKLDNEPSAEINQPIKPDPDVPTTSVRMKQEPNPSFEQSSREAISQFVQAESDFIEPQHMNVKVKKEKSDDVPVKKEKSDKQKLKIRAEERQETLEKQKLPNRVEVKKERIQNSKPEKQRTESRKEKNETKKKIKTEAQSETDQNFNVNPVVKTEKGNLPVKIEKGTSTQIKDVKKDDTVRAKQEYKLGSGIEWEASMLAELMELDFWVAKSIVSLFKNDCTIPFIARYRRDFTNNMDADQLRHVKDAYEYIKTLESKAQNILKQLQKADKLTRSLENSIFNVRSLEELEYLYAPYKQGSSKSKAEKARSLGLEQAAWIVLHGTDEFVPAYYENSSKQGLTTNDEVIQGVQNIMADIFSKDESVLEYIHKIENRIQIMVKSTKMKSSSDKKKTDDEKGHDDDAAGKFRIYYDFQKSTKDLLPHQILALNRGENQKVLSVKMQVSDSFYQELYKFCFDKWLRTGRCYALRTMMFNTSFKDSYSRLITPLLSRRVRSKLNRKAQQTAIENFALNLKSLLQASPVKGCSILGVDPGIRHGIKFALISKTGYVLWTTVLHFDFNDTFNFKNEQNMKTLKRNMVSHNCELIALGNGTGCRMIENIISEFLKSKFFAPELNIEYTIVNERGASIYSCSAMAKEEFPNLDPNLISAVFIARTLQDPLSEFVKVEPKHLGVGSYQHDMPVKELHQTLDEIVVECVSFTGVDVNTASLYLLKRVAGLSASKAANIIEYRRVNGPLKNREQITLVKGIGPKSFEQAAGFIRIHPQTCTLKVEESNTEKKTMKKKPLACSDDINPLDRTWIHPESYAIAYLFMDLCGANLAELGTPKFIDQINRTVTSRGIIAMAQELNQSEDLLSLIFDALTKPSDYDYRSQFSKPIFSKGLTSIESLSPGVVLQGRVGNVTVFGAFVDIGVGKDGLIHSRNMNRIKIQIGDMVEVKILHVEVQSGRIGLYLIKKL